MSEGRDRRGGRRRGTDGRRDKTRKRRRGHNNLSTHRYNDTYDDDNDDDEDVNGEDRYHRNNLDDRYNDHRHRDVHKGFDDDLTLHVEGGAEGAEDGVGVAVGPEDHFWF